MTKEKQKLNINILKLKVMKNLKLNKLEEQNLAERQMNVVKGGLCTCGCGCLYANSGGSSTDANANANKSSGIMPNGKIVKVYCDGVWYKDTDPDTF
jgi:natural product precursor